VRSPLRAVPLGDSPGPNGCKTHSIGKPQFPKAHKYSSGPSVIVPVELPPAPDPDPYRDPLSLAVVDEVAENGERATAAGVIARAGVRSEDFYARYSTLEGCALDTIERFIAAYKRRTAGAFNMYGDWRDSLRAAAYETADAMEESQALVDFMITGALQMNSELCRVRREELFIFGGRLIDLGRTEPSEINIAEGAAMFAVGSILQLLTYRLQSGGPVEPHAMVPEMMYAVVRSYRGEREAREELSLPRSSAVSTTTAAGRPR
jgi:hypothetical protein